MSHSPEHDLIERLRHANPAPVEQLRAEISADDHVRARERAIEAGEEGGERPSEPPSSRWRPLGLGTLGAGVLAAGVAIMVAIVVLGGSPVGPSDQPAFAGAAVEVAETNPRLLIGVPGWSVARADEFEPDQGSMEFSDGEHRLSLDWSQPPAGVPVFDLTEPPPSMPELDQWYRSPLSCLTRGGSVVDCASFARRSEIDVLGATAVLSESRTVYPDHESTGFSVYLPPAGRTSVSLHTTGAPALSRAELMEVLDSLYPTDVETWLGALPPRIVRPLERPEVVDEMLAGVPIPASVDLEELKDEASASSRYHLGAAVTGAVACGWLDQWASAVETGDPEAADEATEAMLTSMDWDILEEMDEQGGWSRTVWEYAREMRAGDRQSLLGVSGTEGYPDGSVYEVGPSYASGLGCESEQRTLRPEESGGRMPPGGRMVPVDAPSKP